MVEDVRAELVPKLLCVWLSVNKGVWALKFTLMLHFEFVAQAVPHQCIAHHGAEHRAAAAAEKTTATAPPSRLWIQSYPG